MWSALIPWLIGLLIVVLIVIWLLRWLYHRGTSNQAFLRTGWGGRKIAIEGGMLVIPVLHELVPVNLGLTKAVLSARDGHALITGDKMRVDIEAEFYFRVMATPEGVARAASALGRLTNQPDQLAGFFEAEFLGALRSVAAETTLAALHDNRAGFGEAVRERVAQTLERAGLELASVAVRDLDQTALEFFKPANGFDAEGLTQLIEKVENRRKQRTEIEQRTSLAIKENNLATEKQALAIDRESQLAKLQQEREIEINRAMLAAEIAREKAQREAESQEARIQSTQATNQREIAAREEVERARLASERALDESRVLREQEMRKLEIEREKMVELRKIEAGMEVLTKSIEEAAMRIEAEGQLTAGAKATEAVSTAKDMAAAERAAALSKVNAEKDATAEALRSQVLAEAQRLLNEAENVLTPDARSGRLRGQLIEKLEAVIRETVRPMEKIDGIKVVHLGGNGGDTSSKTPTDEVIDSALRYRVQAPMIDELLKDIGVEGANVSKMGDVFRAAKDAQSLAAAKPEKKEDKGD